MTDLAQRICDELRVSREEAIFYLEGFDWDSDAAMEACRGKTLNFPSLAVESPPEKEKPSPEVQSTTADSRSRNELIVQFVDLAVGSDTRDATSYLERNDWDLQRAVSQFCDERRPTRSQRKMDRKKLWREEQVPKVRLPLVSSHVKVQESTNLVEYKEEKLSPVKESAEGTLSSMSLSQIKNTPEEKLSHWEEESIESFFKVAIGASREAAVACLSHCKWNEDDAISYFFGDYTEAVQESTSPVKESAEALSSSMSLMQLTDSPDEQLSLLKEEIVKSFRDVVTVASRKAAEACLSHCKWIQEDAISYFFGDYIAANPEIAWSQADVKAVDEDSRTESLEEASGAKSHVKIQESSSPTQTRECSLTSSNQLQSSRGKLSQWNDKLINSFVGLADGVVTRDVATVYLTESNWNVEKAFSCLLEETSQVQASQEGQTESSSSLSNTDSTETGNATVASSQMDENVKDNDVEEDLGTEDNRDYYLKSDTGVEYRDLDTTLHSITSGSRGSTFLHQ